MAKKATEDAQPVKMLEKSEFTKLKSRYENLQTASSENSADRKQLLKDFKAKGLHPEAFKLVMKLDKLLEGNRDSFLANFDLYAEHLGWRRQGDLLNHADADKKNREEAGKKVSNAVKEEDQGHATAH